MLFIIILLSGLFIYGVIEYRSHLKNVFAIPIRVHVNGTRGKSSLTRLIAGGLRAGGIRTFAKTTGTKPRMIHEDGNEYPIYRPGKANIIEQLKVFRLASSLKVEAIVVECMAVQPALQKIMEDKLVRSTLGVISNVRADHIDEMGPTIKDIARSLCNTIPREGVLFTAEEKMLSVIQDQADKNGCKVHPVKGIDLPDFYMNGFSYIEHKENVALALDVCEYFGVKKDVAIQGMYKAMPDPGVLRIYRVNFYQKILDFINAFAANDPDSTLLIWNHLKIKSSPVLGTIIIANCRKDRLFRSEQLGELIARDIQADHYILTGDYTQVVLDRALSLGLVRSKISNMGNMDAGKVFEKVVELCPQRCIITGIGNIVGFGEEIVHYFSSRGKEITYGEYLYTGDRNRAPD